MKRWKTWSIALLALVVFGAIGARAIVARKAQQAQQAAPIGEQVFELAPSDVLALEPVELVRTVPVSGGIKAVDSALVKARIASIVQDITVREGDPVRRGQLLGRLDTAEFELRVRQADEQATAAKSQLDLAERALANNRALVAQGFISQNALDTSVMNAAGARASLQAAQAAADLARKSLHDAQIRAPLDGSVAQRFVQPGERVAVDARLLEIVDLSRIELEAAISADRIGEVRVGQRALLHVDGLADPIGARVTRINPATQEGTRAVLVYLALDPGPRLRQGLFARGAIELARAPALAVPRSAVRVDGARPHVFVVEGGKVVQRDVTLGAQGIASFGDRREEAVTLASGVAAGDRLLLGSAGSLREGSRVRLAPIPAAAGAAAALPASAGAVAAR